MVEPAEDVSEEAAEDKTETEPVAEEPATEEVRAKELSEEKTEIEKENGPLEDWTKKELMDECKTSGLSDKGNKAALIERIK